MDLIHCVHGSQEIVAALSGAASIAFTALWKPFAERRQVLSEEAAIKVVLGAELSLHAGYALEALQRVTPLPKRSTRFRQHAFVGTGSRTCRRGSCGP